MGLDLSVRIYIFSLIVLRPYVAQAGLRFIILIPQLPEFYDCEHTPSSLVLKIKFLACLFLYF